MSGGKYEFLYNAAWDFHNRLTEGKNNDYEPEDGQSQSIQECIKIFKTIDSKRLALMKTVYVVHVPRGQDVR